MGTKGREVYTLGIGVHQVAEPRQHKHMPSGVRCQPTCNLRVSTQCNAFTQDGWVCALCTHIHGVRSCSQSAMLLHCNDLHHGTGKVSLGDPCTDGQCLKMHCITMATMSTGYLPRRDMQTGMSHKWQWHPRNAVWHPASHLDQRTPDLGNPVCAVHD
jgi:hypothetical protein